MKLKTRHEHPENQRREMRQQLLKKQQEETKEAKACLELNKLMKEV